MNPVLRWIFAIGAAYIGLLLLLFIFQDHLLYFPQSISPKRSDLLGIPKNTETLEFTMQDGVKVRGWLVKNASQKPLKLLFYYGGNAEELFPQEEESGKFSDWSLVLVNYRGYGESGGKPGEESLKRDALEIYDAMLKRPDVDSRNVVLMGRSLGTGIAVHLAAHRPHAGVILVSPYDSMVSVATRHYPFFPVDLLLRHRFDSLQWAPVITSPVLMLAADDDSIVPKSHSRSLAEHWGGEVNFIEIAKTDHNTIGFHPFYWAAIQKFLKEISRQ